MADEEGLTREQLDAALDWLEKVSPGGATCSVCAKNTWEVGKSLVAPMRIQGRTTFIDGELHPLVTVTCKNCGHTIFVNAVMAGVEKPSEEGEGDG